MSLTSELALVINLGWISPFLPTEQPTAYLEIAGGLYFSKLIRNVSDVEEDKCQISVPYYETELFVDVVGKGCKVCLWEAEHFCKCLSFLQGIEENLSQS